MLPCSGCTSDRRHRAEALGDGVAQHAVHVPLLTRVPECESSADGWRESGQLDDGRRLGGDVIPGGMRRSMALCPAHELLRLRGEFPVVVLWPPAT